jgi:hypothetical protein
MRRRRIATLAVGLTIAIGAVATGSQPPVSAAATVARVSVRSEPSDLNGSQVKEVVAYCLTDEYVVGGGLVTSPFSLGLTITRSAPTTGPDGRYGWAAGAATIEPNRGDWRVRAYAVCAAKTSISGYHINDTPTEYSSASTPKKTEVTCNGQKALTAGAWIQSTNPSRVGLQLVRTDGIGGLTRATAREVSGGTPASWRLTGYAVCADAPDGYEVRYGALNDNGSTTSKSSNATCDDDQVALGVGGAIGTPVSDHVMLNSIVAEAAPGEPPYGGFARAAEVYSTPANWNMVAQAICVTA